MKYKSIAIAILILCASVAMTVLAQSGNEEIGGAGTPNFIAKFLTAHKIGNSNIFQSPSGNIGIGTTTPGIPLEVVSNSTSQQRCCPGPSAIFAESTGSADLTIGITGLAAGRCSA